MKPSSFVPINCLLGSLCDLFQADVNAAGVLFCSAAKQLQRIAPGSLEDSVAALKAQVENLTERMRSASRRESPASTTQDDQGAESRPSSSQVRLRKQKRLANPLGLCQS